MYNWSVDEKRFKKENPKEYRLWRLTQLINYGLDGEKLDREEVKAAWPKIKDKVDRYKRVAMEYFLFNKLNKPLDESPVLENPYQEAMKKICPICRFEDAKEKGLVKTDVIKIFD